MLLSLVMVNMLPKISLAHALLKECFWHRVTVSLLKIVFSQLNFVCPTTGKQYKVGDLYRIVFDNRGSTEVPFDSTSLSQDNTFFNPLIALSTLEKL
jgi:hypothetical protein